jgi:hypothetical protein
MKRIPSALLFSTVLALCLAAAPAFATNPDYNAGDLVLYFQKPGGSSNAVYVDLGSAATVFRGSSVTSHVANKVGFLNINSTLVSAFNPSNTDPPWATDPTVYAGAAGVFSNSTFNTVTNGDPARTLYVSCPRSAVGTVGSANSAAWTFGGNTAMTGAASGIQSQNNDFFNNYTGVQAVAANGAVATQNPFYQVGSTYYQGNAFQANFAGGVEQSGTATSFGTFGAAGSVKFALDIYRIVPSTGLTGEVAGTLRTGDYLGTLTVDASGNVSFIAHGSSSPSSNPTYNTWIAGYPSINTLADQVPTADPDHDGANNLQEFAFGGSPASATDNGASQPKTVDANGDSLKDLTLTLEVRSGAVFTASGNNQTATVDGVTYLIQGSADLTTWNSQVTEVTPNLGTGSPHAGYVFKTFRLVAGNGLAGKGFLRASVTM